MISRALVCDCCGKTIAVGGDIADMRQAGLNAGGPGGSVYIARKDMCGTCWGRGCEFGKKHHRRAA